MSVTRRIDAPTRLLTWAIRRWKEQETMADQQQQKKKPGSDGISKKTISLYARLIGDDANVQLNKEEKELFAALLVKKFPQLSMIAELADTPVKPSLKARTKLWGDRLFYVACGVGCLFVLYIALKGD